MIVATTHLAQPGGQEDGLGARLPVRLDFQVPPKFASDNTTAARRS